MKNLKFLRNQRNLSQQKLAESLHVSQQSIYKYEHNITSPDIETLINMADFFNTSVDYIIDYTDIPQKAEPATETNLNKDELELITKYRKLTKKQKQLTQMLIDEYNRK